MSVVIPRRYKGGHGNVHLISSGCLCPGVNLPREYHYTPLSLPVSRDDPRRCSPGPRQAPGGISPFLFRQSLPSREQTASSEGETKGRDVERGRATKEGRRSVDSIVMNDEFSLCPYQYALEEAGRLTYSPSTTFRATRRVTVLRPRHVSRRDSGCFSLPPSAASPSSNERTRTWRYFKGGESFLNGARSRYDSPLNYPG